MRETERAKPRFTRVVKDGQLWLRDRKGFKTVGPFATLADALAHELMAERGDLDDLSDNPCR
jgi:hypothetical protein